MDDLIYLLNCPDYYQTLREGDPELEMSKLMTSIWANFAAYSKPHIGGLAETREIWQPIVKAQNKFSPLRFLDLSLHPRMVEDPYVARYNFWRREIDPNP